MTEWYDLNINFVTFKEQGEEFQDFIIDYMKESLNICRKGNFMFSNVLGEFPPVVSTPRMTEEVDFNDAIDEIVRGEERQEQSNYEEGLKAGRSEGNQEGYHLGYHRGAELGAELGYYLGVVSHHLSLHSTSEAPLYSEKIHSQLTKVQRLIKEFPRTNSEEHDLLGSAEVIRAQFRKACALIKIDSRYPYTSQVLAMESHLIQLHRRIDRVASYLRPLLPFADCHTVELLTRKLWQLVPGPVRREVDEADLERALDCYWRAAEGDVCDDSPMPELAAFVGAAREHHMTVDGNLCLSGEQARRRVEAWGGRVVEYPQLEQFVSPKKAHEVCEMMWLVGSLGGTHCVELGGGKGYLGEALARCRGLATLTVDCDGVALAGGEKRARVVQRVMKSSHRGGGQHRYANEFVDERTDLVDVVRRAFPEDSLLDCDAALVITGLHTCGDLGPSSLRILVRERAARALCNVPCCYHLLSERVREHTLWDESESPQVERNGGFPMSQRLRGYQLGRNARMLASQSIDRTVASRAIPPIGLHYRAILQVLLKEHYPRSRIAEGRLKGVAAKSQNFQQYFKMATEKLGVSIQLPDNIEDEYERHRKSMVMFYLLRLSLAQAVECLILLDRLCYLMENGFEKSFIVRLFDAAKSPRCHAIVALR